MDTKLNIAQNACRVKFETAMLKKGLGIGDITQSWQKCSTERSLSNLPKRTMDMQHTEYKLVGSSLCVAEISGLL